MAVCSFGALHVVTKNRTCQNDIEEVAFVFVGVTVQLPVCAAASESARRMDSHIIWTKAPMQVVIFLVLGISLCVLICLANVLGKIAAFAEGSTLIRSCKVLVETVLYDGMHSLQIWTVKQELFIDMVF